MSPEELTWTLREDSRPGERGERELRWAQAGWLLDELRFVWREAAADSAVAYDYWRRTQSRDAYTVYLAARDRADAAHDALSHWHGRAR